MFREVWDIEHGSLTFLIDDEIIIDWMAVMYLMEHVPGPYYVIVQGSCLPLLAGQARVELCEVFWCMYFKTGIDIKSFQREVAQWWGDGNLYHLMCGTWCLSFSSETFPSDISFTHMVSTIASLQGRCPQVWCIWPGSYFQFPARYF